MDRTRSRRRRSTARRVGRWLGLAGLLGVAAGGALVARNERQRRAYTPEQVRARLHERAAAAGRSSTSGRSPETPG